MEQENTLHSPPVIKQILTSPYLALIGAALFWSGNFVVGRAMRGDASPIPLNFWRWVFALIILLPLSYRQLQKNRTLIQAEWKVIVGLGLTGIAAFHICVYIALTSTTAINALLFLSTAPVATVIASWLFFKDTINQYQAAGGVVSLMGAVIIIGRGNPEILWNLQFNQGDLWMLVAVLIWAVYSVLLKRRPAQLPPLALLTSSVIAGIIWMIPVYLISLAMGQKISVNSTTMMGMVYIGVFASVLAFLFWNKGVAQIGPNRASIFIHLMPFFGAFLSILFLGEGLALYHAGAIFIFLGIAISCWRQKDR